MNNVSVFLDVALSLTFFYLVASMFVSGITEFINTIIEKRAVLLRKALGKLETAWTDRDTIMQSPFIRLYENKQWKIWNKSVSYISARSFVSVILSRFSESENKYDLDQIKTSIARLSDSDFKRILSALANEALTLKDFEKKLAIWFDEYMDQVTDWYKRYNRIVVWAVAAVVSVALNLDSVLITRRLYKDPSIRNAMVAQALETARQKNFESFQNSDQKKFLEYLYKKDTTLVNSLFRINLESGKDSNTVDSMFKKYTGSDSARMQQKDWNSPKFIGYVQKEKPAFVKKQLALVSDQDLDLLKVKEEYTDYLQSNMASLGIPMGWEVGMRESFSIVWSVIGWALTTAALSFGAPFWFDLLVKLVNIRNVVKPKNAEVD